MQVDRASLIGLATTGLRPNTKGWIRAHCPFCELREGSPDRKVSFGLDTRGLWYSCYRCGIKGRLKAPLDEFDSLYAGEDAEPELLPGIDGPPPGFLRLSEEPARSASVYDAAWDYLLSPQAEGGRGLTEAIVTKAGIGVSPHPMWFGRVIVPVLDAAGRWVWYVGRVWKKKAERPYMYPKGARYGAMYNEAAIDQNTTKPLLLVEGCFDAIPFFPDAAAFLGKPTDLHVKRLAQATRPLVLVLDGDAVDEGWALAFRLRLLGKQAGSVRLPPRIDPDEVPAHVLWAAAARALEHGEADL
jgi:hypothetical protein